MNILKTYALVTKPGIIMGNLITTTAGFAMASQNGFDVKLFFVMFLGLGMIIASACVMNNHVDRAADLVMQRTKKRSRAMEMLTPSHTVLFAAMLGFLGLTLLAVYTNFLATMIASLGFFIYVVCYSFWKYATRFSTLVGSIAGAIPPVVGYAAASNTLDLNALLLFLLLVTWQMPHFYAIALFRLEDYRSANIPVLPLVKGIDVTRRHMLYYTIAFIAPALALIPTSSYLYFFSAPPLVLSWLSLAICGFYTEDVTKWARSMFRLSLVIITLLSITLSISQ